MNVGEKIKKYRLEKGLTQQELGQELGVGKAAVQKYESGQVQNLKSTHIKKLCLLFNRRPWDFIFDDELPAEEVAYTNEEIIHLHNQFGPELISLLRTLTQINNKGHEKIKEYIQDISKIDDYRL